MSSNYNTIYSFFMGNKTSKTSKTSRDVEEENVDYTDEVIDSMKDIVCIQNQSNKKEFFPKTFKNLIVDDARFNREILSKYLMRFGIESDEASNGKEALLIRSPDQYDIIWMDLRMPIMNGFECTELLRKEGYRGVIIGVTGDVSERNMNLCYKMGMNHVILKPIIYHELMHLFYIKKYLEIPKHNNDKNEQSNSDENDENDRKDTLTLNR